MTDAMYPEPVRKDFNQRFWQAIEDEQLLLQRCTDCNHTPYPPRTKCPSCFGELEWFEASGAGTVYSYGIVHRPNQPEVFEYMVPITVAIIELDEGPLFVSNIVGCAPDEVSIGDRVRAVFETVAEDVTLPKFELA
jgi:uncharacterized OB-fold protein